MALDNYWMHATMFNTFAPDVLKSLQNKNCALVLYTNFKFSLYSEALNTVHFKV